MPSTSRSHPAPDPTVRVAVRLTAVRTSVHDLVLSLELPAGTAASLPAVRRHLEDLQPGVLAAACTDETVDRLTDVAVLDVLALSAVIVPPEEVGGDE
ncbi:hypothetical protein ACWEQL_20295 [Kitasatospora sp. NPDC004240]